MNPLNPANKKFRRRKKDGKRIQRRETEMEKRDRIGIMPKELASLARGIVEDDDSLQPLDIHLEDEEEEDDDDDDCLISDRWAKIASGNPATQEKIKQSLSESRIFEAKKKKPKKKNCNRGNPNHDTDGEWSASGTKGSWSVSNPDGKDDCDHGKLKATGKGKHKTWVKQPCGRADRKTPDKKAKYKCKSGELNETEEQSAIDHVEFPVDTGVLMDLQDRLQKILDNQPRFLKHLSYLLKPLVDDELKKDKDHQQQLSTVADKLTSPMQEKKARRMTQHTRDSIKASCARYGFFGWSDFLMKLNAIEAAKKGNIGNKRN